MRLNADHICNQHLSHSPLHAISKGGAIYLQFPAVYSSYTPTYHGVMHWFRHLEEKKTHTQRNISVYKVSSVIQL